MIQIKHTTIGTGLTDKNFKYSSYLENDDRPNAAFKSNFFTKIHALFYFTLIVNFALFIIYPFCTPYLLT
jgi:hypothetical protein